MSTLKQRFLLVSDMHYTVDENAEQLRRIYPNAIASPGSGDAFGHTQREKIEKIYEDIIAENQRSELDAVFVLGDISLDDYDYRNLPDNYCKKFINECLDRLPCPSYVLPGNHDSYPSDIWKEIFGYDREYVVEIDGTVFVMLDTFKALPASAPCGADYTKIDYDFLKSALDKYKGKRMFLCAHYFDANSEDNKTFTDAVRDLIKVNNDIVFMYRGHTHINSVTDMGDAYGGKRIIDIGGYGYKGEKINGKYVFSIFDFKWAWGYQIIEVYDEFIKTYHLKPDAHYVASNGCFDVKETVEGEIVFDCKKI